MPDVGLWGQLEVHTNFHLPTCSPCAAKILISSPETVLKFKK